MNFRSESQHYVFFVHFGRSAYSLIAKCFHLLADADELRTGDAMARTSSSLSSAPPPRTTPPPMTYSFFSHSFLHRSVAFIRTIEFHKFELHVSMLH